MTATTHAAARADSLGEGAAGIALLHIERARAGTGTWAAAHHWASEMLRHPTTAHPDIAGLYRGAPAVAYVLRHTRRNDAAATLNQLDRHVDDLIRSRLRRAHQRIDQGQPATVAEYDLISGLTGLGVYLLQRAPDGELLREVLAYLARLTCPLHLGGEPMPGWWCTQPGPTGRRAPESGGFVDCGLAHGIAGPLALLATAMRRDVTVTGHTDAMHRILAFLDHRRGAAGRRCWWPERINHAEWRTGDLAQHRPPRPSWCYGTPGIARAQQLAGIALADPQRQHHAEQVLTSCVTDPTQLAQLTDPSLCHGWAGLVHTTRCAATDTGAHSDLAATLPRLERHLDEYLTEHGTAANIGLLDGSTGIHLTRHHPYPPAKPPWDACLLTSA